MKISERIAASETKLVELKSTLTELLSTRDDMEEGADGINEIDEQIETTTAEIEGTAKRLDSELAAENALARKAVNLRLSPGATGSGPAVIKGKLDADGDPLDRIVRSALVSFESYIKRVPVEQVFAMRFPNDEATKAVFAYVNKAPTPQAPAMTNVDGWAAELTRESFGAFMDLIANYSILPNLGLAPQSFNGATKITIPQRTGKRTDDPNLAGAFRAEGDPIRVGAVSLGSTAMTPKNFGVIGTFTNELFDSSTPNIEAAIRRWIQDDSAEALDGHFLGSTPRNVTHPGGIQAGLDASDTRVSAGNTAANIKTDGIACVAEMMADGVGRAPKWIMHETNWLAVSTADNAVGTPAFPETQSGKTWMGYPVLTSINVPADIVYLVDTGEVFYAGDTPRFLGTEVATIHEEYSNADVKPIVGEAPVDISGVADPVRSLFQTNSSALRMTSVFDWLIARAGAVQTVTGVTWIQG